jgi:2,3-bisphosphoglycerate-dependent phosphoglycerate mutase
MATVILARHGRTTANATGVLAGRSKGVDLDEHGVAQARAAAERLAGLPVAAIVTSPLERCRQTARELKTLAKEPLWRTVQAHPSAAAFPGGESMAAMAARAVATVRRWDARIEAEHGPDAVWVAVSHGDVIKAVLADALGMHLDAFQRIVVDPASLSVVRYTPMRPFVVASNTSAGDLAHLRPATRSRRRRRATSDAAVGGGAGPAGRTAGSSRTT